MSEQAQRIQQLIQAARGDDASALNELLGRFRNYLTILAMSHKDQALGAKLGCSDLVQETLVNAHLGFAKFRGHSEAELAAWLRQTLTNQLIDLVRRYRTLRRDVKRERSLEAMVEASSQAVQNFLGISAATPSQQAGQREMGVVLSDALQSLEPELRDVVICKNLKEMNWKATAQELNTTVGAARVMWTKALAKLRPLLESSR